jgi:hypothetical protein
MTDREKHMIQCAEELLQYCNEHKDSCDGCVLYHQIKIGKIAMASCKLSGSPTLWNLEEDKEL